LSDKRQVLAIQRPTKRRKLSHRKMILLRNRTAIIASAVLIIAIVAILLFPKAEDELLHLSYPVKYEEIVKEQAKEFGLDRDLVFAVIRTESGFDKNAVSHAGAKGLMQLTDDTFLWMQNLLGESYTDIYDPEANIRCGCALLSHLKDHYGSEKLAICAYNAGIGNVDSWLESGLKIKNGKDIPFPETESYLQKVLSAKEMYEKLY